MKMKRMLIYLTVFTFILAASVFADDFSKTGTVGAQFLKIGVGSRYQGLGEASVAVVNDAYSMYWNPAGLAYIESSNLTFTNVNWITDIALNYISFGTRVEGLGVIGLSATLLTMGDMEITTVDEPDGTGQTFTASDFSMSVGFARHLTTRLTFGAAIKYVHESIYNETASGIAFDFGTQLNTGFKSLRLGMNISNMGPSMKFSGPDLISSLDIEAGANDDGTALVEDYDLPLTFRLGIAYDFMSNADSRWTWAAEAKHPNDADQQASLGSEFAWQEKYFLRAGYKLNYDEQGLTLGGGLETEVGNNTILQIDYAWSNFDYLESVHRFSLGFCF